MKQGLSKREKILLFSAGLLVLFYLSVQFAIIPLANRYRDGVQDRNTLSIEERHVRTEIANKQSTEQANIEAKTKFEAIKQEYPLLVPNEEVVTILTNLCLKNALSPSRLSIITPTAPSRSGNGPETPGSLFTIITASTNLTGTYSSLTRLLDEVDTMQYIRITNLGYSASRQADDDISSITLSFELTFINP